MSVCFVCVNKQLRNLLLVALCACVVYMSIVSCSWKFNAAVLQNGSVLVFSCTNDREPSVMFDNTPDKITAVVAGEYYFVAVSDSGHVFQWSVLRRGPPKQVPRSAFGKARIEHIASGAGHVVAVTEDGCAWTWGRNTYGQLGLGYAEFDTQTRAALCSRPTRVRDFGIGQAFGRVHAAGAGCSHTVLISNGAVYTCGYAVFGQLGRKSGLLTSYYFGRVPIFNVKFASVSVGSEHSLAVTDDGDLYAWGYNLYGQLGMGDRIDRFRPVKINIDSVHSVACGDFFTIALDFFRILHTWGCGEDCTLGLSMNRTLDRLTPGVVSAKKLRKRGKLCAISGGIRQALAVSTDGNLYRWGILHKQPEHIFRSFVFGRRAMTCVQTETMCMGKHRRLGTETWFFQMPEDVLHMIARCI